MLANLIKLLCANNYSVSFEKGGAAGTTTVHLTRDEGDGQLAQQATHKNPFYALFDALTEAGVPEFLSAAARDLGKVGEKRTLKQREAAVLNGKRGGRPKGAKDSYKRSRTSSR